MKDSEKFQMNVEVVSKALQEQAQTREPEEEARKLYKKFNATRHEPERLAVALRGFFLPQAEPEEREAYGKYLKGRIRPAVEAGQRRIFWISRRGRGRVPAPPRR